MKKIIYMLVALMLVSLVYAQTAEELYAGIEIVVSPFVGRSVPMYGDEIVNVYLIDETPIGYAITSDDIFEEIGPGETENSTMNIYIENGRVISGYIRGSWTMTTVAGGRITFQEGFVRWTRDGVETGQLDGDWTITTKSNNRITFKDKHVVSFDKDGVWQGTLSGKWTCTTCDGSRITFKNYIIFSKCGVASGHLSGAWTIGGRNYRDGQRVYFYE